jgi:hypothetical protein
MIKGYSHVTSTVHLISLFENKETLCIAIKENDSIIYSNLLFINNMFIINRRVDPLKVKVERWHKDNVHKSFLVEAILKNNVYYKLDNDD